jgi:hypothetical protein
MKKIFILAGIFIVSAYFAANYSGVYSPLLDVSNAPAAVSNTPSNKENESLPTPKGAPVLLPKPNKSNKPKQSNNPPANPSPAQEPSSSQNQNGTEKETPPPVSDPSPAPTCIPDTTDPSNTCPNPSPTPPPSNPEIMDQNTPSANDPQITQ